MKKVAVSEDSDQVANPNRPQRKSMLQKTVESTLGAAKDRSRGVKRERSIVDEILLTKLARINFVEQEESETIENSAGTSNAVMTHIGNSLDVEMNPEKESKSDSTSEINDSRQSETIGNSLKLCKVAKPNGPQRKSIFQKTVESAPDAAKDRARGVKREGGIVEEILISKLPRINYVEQEEIETIENSTGTSNAVMTNSNIGYTDEVEINPAVESKSDSTLENKDSRESETIANSAGTSKDLTTENQIEHSNDVEISPAVESNSDSPSGILDSSGYLNELLQLQCVDVGQFKQNMFNTYFGKLVLFIQPRTSKLANIQASCQTCQVPIQIISGEHTFTIRVNNRILAETSGPNEQMAKQKAEELAWDTLTHGVISVLEKHQLVAQDDTLVGVTDSGNNPPEETLGTIIGSSVASKMSYQMGGRLGASTQGIAESKKLNIQKINRAGLCSTISDIRTFKKWAASLMKRFVHSWCLDEILFSTDFSKAEREALHQYAQKYGLICISYESNSEKCLDVKKKLDPFSKVRALIEAGGSTYTHKVFIPIAFA